MNMQNKVRREIYFQHKYNKNINSMHTKYIFKLAIYIISKPNMHNNNKNNSA